MTDRSPPRRPPALSKELRHAGRELSTRLQPLTACCGRVILRIRQGLRAAAVVAAA